MIPLRPVGAIGLPEDRVRQVVARETQNARNRGHRFPYQGGDRSGRPAALVQIAPEIVERARKGDADAFAHILEVFEEPVYRTVWRLIGGRFPNDIEDVAQEIFLKIFRNLDRFDPERGVKFSTWVYTFVKNHCFDVLKKRHLPTVSMDAPQRDGEEVGGYDPPTREPSPPLRLVHSEIGERVAAAVDRLSPDQRMAFVLREYEGLDYREIAQVLGCSQGTVKSRLYRAKEALRRYLAPYVEQEPDRPLRGERA